MKKSKFIIPISVIFHVITLNLVLYLFTPETYCHAYSIIYYNVTWLIVTHNLNFYPTARREGFMTNLSLFFSLFLFYGFAFFASFSLQYNNPYRPLYLIGVYLIICAALTLYRILFYWAREIYRANGLNNVKVIVIGRDKNLKKLRSIFDTPWYGYQYMGYFDNSKSNSPTYLGDIQTSFTFIFEKNIEEVYCMASRLSKDEIKYIMSIADNSLKRIKIIPDNKELFSRAMTIELFDKVPVLNLRASPLDIKYANLIKRLFDFVFASLVIVLLLSWLTPIIYVIMRLDSKGPLFFKQKRHGVNLDTFWCYKFRSMTKTKESDRLMATKNDMRVTRVDKFLRKTSLDELPQFFNVLKGEMSVVGPRPHMEGIPINLSIL